MIPEISLSNLKPNDKVEPKDLATKVQGMFVEVMLKAMENSVEAEDGLFGNSSSSEIYRGMIREQFASAISAQMRTSLEDQLQKKLTSPSTLANPNSEIRNPQSELDAALPVSGRVSSPQGWRRDPINGELRYHAGTDIAAPAGTEIHAVADGRVIESGPKGGYGNAVVIQTEDGRKMLYAHNNQNFVQVGDWVSRGDAIAEVGSTGRATGPHVHFEVKF